MRTRAEPLGKRPGPAGVICTRIALSVLNTGPRGPGSKGMIMKQDSGLSLVRAVLAAMLLLAATLGASAASAAIGDELGCISGDCENGYGTLVEKGELGLYRYRGPFVDGKFHGFGELELVDKRMVYKGNFALGKRSGRGTEWDRNRNDVYIGQWRSD